MREVPRSYLDNYTKAINEVSARGQEYLSGQLKSIDYDRPIADVRQDLIGLMDAVCGGSSQMAAMESAIFYDGLRERVLGSQMGAFAQDMRQPIATEKALKAFIQKLVDGEYDEFEALCLERLDWEVKAAAGRCTQYNAERDPYGGETRYARVPTGEETCDFCIMLASRGPVYHTEESAGAYDHYHAHCDCRIVPFWGTYDAGPSRRGSIMGIEGYDPDALYERYVDQMLNPNFRNRMARAADRARGGTGNATGRETSHPQLWAKALRDGTVTLGSVGEVQHYIRDAESYEDLFERIKLINKELPYYGLSSNYIRELQRELYDKRKQFIK